MSVFGALSRSELVDLLALITLLTQTPREREPWLAAQDRETLQRYRAVLLQVERMA